jgi:hypothetical protein
MRLGIATLGLTIALTITAGPAPSALADRGETASGLSAPKPSAPRSTVIVVPEAPLTGARVEEDDPSVYVGSDRARELRFLKSSLAQLAYEESNSVVDGLLHTMMGGIWIGFGAGLNDLDPSIRAYYFVQGSSMLARATLSFAIRPNARRASLEMDTMSSRNPAEADARIAFGAAALKKLAKQHRIKRLLGSSLSIAAGIIPLPFALNSGISSISGGWSIIVFVGAGIDIITGIIGLAIRTEAEKRHRAYEQIRATREPRVSEIRLGFMPVLGGGGLNLSLGF